MVTRAHKLVGSDGTIPADAVRKGEPPTRSDGADSARRSRIRRISYFMLFRLGILAMFTIIAGFLFYTGDERFEPGYAAFVWGALMVGYVLTIVYARILPRARNLDRFAAIQTAGDIVLTAAVVEVSGGVESGFVTLYLISVLGAATMGGPRQTWAAATTCGSVYLVLSTLEFFDVVRPFGLDGRPPLPPREHWFMVGRTLAGLVGVSLLSSYLNVQLSTSVSQVGALRMLNENIVRSLNSGLLTTDLDGNVLYFNPTARTILDLDDDLIGHSVDQALPGIEFDRATGGPEARQDLQVRTATGREIHVGLSRAPLIDASGQAVGYVINFQDVTRLHELAQQVRRNERLAALGGLAASVAHEIRNPLAAISGSAELLGTADLGEEDRKLLDIIRRESGRLGNLVSDLLAFTRPRPPQITTIDLGTAVREVRDAFAHDPAAAELDVRCEADPEVMVRLDPAQLSQVLWNLLRNAADAIDGAGRGGSIELAVKAEGDRALVTVRDSGKGIDPEHLESIFDPFFTTKDSGTGFGLAIVHRIVEDNGGSISAASEPGQGAVFTLSFPRLVGGPEPSDSGVLEL